MTIILALDTSTDACSVALNCHGTVVSHFELTPQSHTKRLLPMIDGLLVEQGKTLSDIDAIAFGCGPGSFTGLRIGMGVVQGLAFGANIPVIPISTLAAMALQVQKIHPEYVYGKVVPLLDARMDQVYAGVFSLLKNLPVAIQAERVVNPEQLVAELAAVIPPQETYVGVGAGWRYPALKALNPVAVELEFYPRAEEIAVLAMTRFTNGEAISAMDAELTYLRNEVSWQKRERKRTE